MKIVNMDLREDGTSCATVELKPGEVLRAFFMNGYYQTSPTHQAVIRGYHIIQAVNVEWCVNAQDWVFVSKHEEDGMVCEAKE